MRKLFVMGSDVRSLWVCECDMGEAVGGGRVEVSSARGAYLFEFWLSGSHGVDVGILDVERRLETGGWDVGR